MKRIDIINQIGNDFLSSNLEKYGEFSYIQAGLPLVLIEKNDKGEKNFKLDIRFEDKSNNLSVLVETININPSKKDKKLHEEKLLNGYCDLETKIRPDNNIILILAESGISNKISVWKKKCNCEIEKLTDTKIKTIKEYVEYFRNYIVNNEIELRRSVLELNEKLHISDIPENIRGQFVGTCLLSLKSNEKQNNSFVYKNLDTSLIIAGMRNVISGLLTNDVNKANKISLIDTKVLQVQNVRNLKSKNFEEILDFIQKNIIPYINSNTNKGQDLLNLFFTTFNKYVGKSDKNQAFTPDHITHFMCKVAGIDKNTKVLDPTCGSGSFIVQALIQELYECETEEERNKVKEGNIFGIEIEEKAYGLSTTNMLIHGDGNSNVRFDESEGCFAFRKWIQDSNIDVVLMNPPYNAKPGKIPPVIKGKNGKIVYTVHNWNKNQREGKTDPTKGFCFVNYIADCVGKDENGNIRQGKKLLCLLPLSCAIGSDRNIQEEKHKILQNNTLDAVFTLPPEIFYPGANVNACCMVFTLGKSHFTRDDKNNIIPRKETFFGYYKDDGFVKKKNLGRISKTDKNNQPLWNDIEKLWLDLYNGTKNDPCLGIRKKVTYTDEWLAEVYIKTDYSTLTQKDFEQTIKNYIAFKILSE